MDSITAQSQVKVTAVPSPKGKPKSKKSSYRNKSSPKASSKPALFDNQPQQKQQQSKKSSAKVAATDIAVPPQRKNTPRSSNRPSQSKKSNSSHRKHSLSAHSNASSSSEDNVPSLMYASTSGTDSDDSDHLDSQLAYGMYSMDINNSSRQPQKTKYSRHQQKVNIVKQQEDVKYAGPTFSNAPTPDMLPLPGFKHEAQYNVELQHRSRDLFSLLVPSSQQQPSPLHDVYNSPPAPYERTLTLGEIQQGLRAFLNIQA